jgi:hypothetical protein
VYIRRTARSAEPAVGMAWNLRLFALHQLQPVAERIENVETPYPWNEVPCFTEAPFGNGCVTLVGLVVPL